MNSSTDTRMLTRSLVLESTPDSIHLIENLVDEFRKQLEFKADVYGNVMIAVTEAVNNGIIHGNHQDPTKFVHVNFDMKTPYCLRVTVRDEGKGFNPESLDDPTAPENIENIGGRGVFLMRHLSDKLEFHDDGRQVEMLFNI